MGRLFNVFMALSSRQSRLALLGVIMLAGSARFGQAAEKMEAARGPAQETAAPTALDSTAIAIRPSALEALEKVGKLGPRRTRAQLLRTGFRADKEKGEVSIQTSAAVELRPIAVAGDKDAADFAVFLVKGCRVTRRTDRLPLDTRFFNSSVTRVSLRQRGADLEVVVALRGPVTAVPRKEAGAAGSWVWVLEFPAVGETKTASAVH